MHRQDTVDCLRKFNAKRKLKVRTIYYYNIYIHYINLGCDTDNNDCDKEYVKYNIIIVSKILITRILGRNLLNKKEAPPSTIKESSESSQTIDEQDGVGTSVFMDKGE